MLPRIFLMALMLAILSPLSFAQENRPYNEKSGLWFGFNTGFYFANKYHAGFYNGKPNNVNNLDYILGNKYWYNEIYQLLNAADTFILDDYPRNMKYKPAMTLGFYILIRNVKDMGFFVQFNYVKLQANDFFSIEVDPATYLTFPDVRLYGIAGKEERSQIDVGIMKPIYKQDDLEITLEGGLNLTSTNVESHIINIEEQEYSLVNVYLNQSYVPNTQLTAYDVKQGGIGYGIFAGSTLKLFFNENLTLDPGFMIYYKNINLEGYNAFKFHYNVFVRFTFRNLI